MTKKDKIYFYIPVIDIGMKQKKKNNEDLRFFDPLTPATAEDLAQTPFTEQPRPSAEQPKPSAEPKPSAKFSVEMPDPIFTDARNLSRPPGKKDFNFTEDDKVLELIPRGNFYIYKYFRRFTIGEINKYFGTAFSKCDSDKNAFECFTSQKNNYNAFVEKNEIFKSLLAAAPEYSGAKARPFEAPSSQSSSSPDNLNQSQKQRIERLIPNIKTLYSNFMTEDVNKENFTQFLITNHGSIDNVDTVMRIYTGGGYSNYKKYLKYKNKYLQLKRLEK